MKPVSNGAKAVFAVAFALFLAVVLVGIALSDNPVKKFFKQQEVLDIAKMHMSQVKSGEVYTGALQFADDIDFDNLALSQVIPMYSARQNGDVVRDESEGYAVYSNGKVVALFGIYKWYHHVERRARGCSEHAERSWHLCALAALRFFRRAVRDASFE